MGGMGWVGRPEVGFGADLRRPLHRRLLCALKRKICGLWGASTGGSDGWWELMEDAAMRDAGGVRGPGKVA